MEYEKSKVDKWLDFSKFQFVRSKILGALMFRTAKLENERRRILEKIGAHYCKDYEAAKDKSSFPQALHALFDRQIDISKQLKAHYEEIDRQPVKPEDDKLL